MNTTSTPTPLRKARIALGMTTTEAGQYVYVSRKTWETWEANEMIGKNPPKAKVELFFEKLSNIGKSRDMGDITVVVWKDPVTKVDYPIDVVTSENYLGFDEENKIIKSMGIRNGKPYVHRTQFSLQDNEHVLRFCKNNEPV